MKTFNILISCMHQEDVSIIERSNVQSDVVVVNQCDRNEVKDFDFINKYGRSCHAKFIFTTERGLSKSRNMAIDNAWGEICLISDDDEVFADDCEEKILKAYQEESDAALIAFSLMRNDCDKQYPNLKNSLGFRQILRTSSHQITFNRNLLKNFSIRFDEKMGSGTGNGGGEENMLMLTVKRHGLKMMYFPYVIATVNPGPSQWFKGYDIKYFENLGWVARRLFGSCVGLMYLVYWTLFRRRVYKNDGVSIYHALKSSLKGFCSKR